MTSLLKLNTFLLCFFKKHKTFGVFFFDFFFSVPGVDLFSTISMLLGVIAAFIVAVPLIYCIRYKDVLKHDVGPKRSGILV